VRPPQAAKPLREHALTVALAHLGVSEEPPGSNRGPEVDAFLRSVGLDPKRGSYPWCAAFCYFCFSRAADLIEVPNPLPRTAGVLDHWNKAKVSPSAPIILLTLKAQAEPSLVLPGSLFIQDFGRGKGHIGFVERIERTAAGWVCHTVEGNPNEAGQREGVAVMRRTRPLKSINRGFLIYEQG
jgi:hypothetical protein